jgi:hypothetical protein
VIEDGAAALDEDQRNVYEEQLIPKIERVAFRTGASADTALAG